MKKTMKKNITLCTTLIAAMSASAHATAVALFDFGSSHGTGSTSQFSNTGIPDVDGTETVNLVTNATLGAAVNDTYFAIGSGLNMKIDTTAGAFTYWNSPWSREGGNVNVNLMGDAWLFNDLGETGFKTLTLSGLSSLLNPNATYSIYLLGSYTSNEYSKFGNVTYDGINLGTKDAPTFEGEGSAITGVNGMAVRFDFTTGATVADTLSFTIGKGTGATGNAPGLQGFAIVAIPEPSSLLLMSMGVLALAVRRRS